MKPIRLSKVVLVSALLLALRIAVVGQNWGPLEGGVGPTSGSTHDAMIDLCNSGLGFGMNVPPVAGSPGSTTVAGVTALEFDVSKLDPNVNYAGFTACGTSGCVIAFDISTWTSSALTPPIDADVLVAFVATAYHELAHVEYASHFGAWCNGNPSDCQEFATCIASLTDSDGNSLGYDAETNNPCAEAYANGNESSQLCQDKLQICANEGLDAWEREALLAALDAVIADASEKCSSQATDCAICGGPPMPSSFLGCGGSCPCP